MAAKIYTVGQVNTYIKNMFESDVVLEHITVSGEISNCKYHTSGHIYFTLKDAGNTLSAVMFHRDAMGLRFRLEDGQKILVTGRVSVYEAAGKYQIYATKIEKVGSGDLFERFQALKKQLSEMGMFDPMYKQKIPAYAKRVGIVTAQTGAAIQDIINISTRRNPYVQLILYPAQVQGIGAAESIVEGIQYLDTYGNVDVMIVGRGGGSIEDLWAFNEEIVAHAIFQAKTPIISAVGHETDFTIADFVSDLRAPTPSAAAELAVYDYALLESRIIESQRRLTDAILHTTEYRRMQIAQYYKALMVHKPEHMIREKRQRLDEYAERMEHSIESKMLRLKGNLSVCAARLDALSPLKRFAGGYSYTTQMVDGCPKPIVSVEDVSCGQDIRVNVSNGYLDAKVMDVKKVDRGTKYGE